MITKKIFLITLANLLLASAASAAGLLSFCDNADNKLCFPRFNGDLVYRIDQGNLGELKAKQAQNQVKKLLKIWNDVPSADINFRLDDTELIDVDVTEENILDFIESSEPLGFSPIIFDADGSIIESLFGSSRSVLGFAFTNFFTGGEILESFTVLNGALVKKNKLQEFQTTFLHEAGHMIGLDHSQSNIGLFNRFGRVSQPQFLPLMFPFSFTGITTELKVDDIASISFAYPNDLLEQNFGEIRGKVINNIEAPVIGTVVTATDIDKPKKKVISTHVDSFAEGTGEFIIRGLPAGTYSLRIDPVDFEFTGGSAVGPYEPASFSIGAEPFYNGNDKDRVSSLKDVDQTALIKISPGDIIEDIIIRVPEYDDDFVNNFNLAQLIDHIDNEITGEINTSGDRDLFKIVLNQSGTLRASTNVPDIGISILDEEANKITDELSSMDQFLEAGEYFISVKSFFIDDGPGKYLLELNFFTGNVPEIIDDHDDDLDSPNLSVLDHSLNNELEVQARLNTLDDKDIFKIVLAKTGLLSLSTVDFFGSSDGRLFDENKNLIKDSTSSFDGNFIIKEILEAGTYFIEVSGTSSTEFTLRSVFDPNAADNEADDFTDENIQTLDLITSSNASIEAAFEGSSDIDVFKFNLPSSGFLAIKLNSDLAFFIEAEILDAQGNFLTEFDDIAFADTLVLGEKLAAGEYFIRLETLLINEDDNSYSVDLNFLPDEAPSAEYLQEIAEENDPFFIPDLIIQEINLNNNKKSKNLDLLRTSTGASLVRLTSKRSDIVRVLPRQIELEEISSDEEIIRLSVKTAKPKKIRRIFDDEEIFIPILIHERTDFDEEASFNMLRFFKILNTP